EQPAEPPDPSAPARPAEPEPRRRRRPLTIVGVIVVGAVIGALIGLLLFGGDADDDEPGSPPAAPSAELAPLAPDFPGRGTARIEGSGGGRRLVMSLRDLPPREEAYAVWLYDTVDDAVLVDRAVGGRLDVDRRLPADPNDYEFIDVSREPLDDNPNHSGASVMRVPVADLIP
ncbi:MAG TPA: anti-sigma factor, partial [Thermoleophilaceae bacterium]|nr:anti-sigma factor [Thermoleophilaceae bacterium]